MSAPFSLEGDLTLDSSVLVEVLGGTEAGALLSSRLEQGVLTAHTSHVSIAESGYVLCRKIGQERAMAAVKDLLDSRVLALEEGEEIHMAASRIKCGRAVSLGDCYTFAVSELTATRPVFLTRERDVDLELSRKPFEPEPLFLR